MEPFVDLRDFVCLCGVCHLDLDVPTACAQACFAYGMCQAALTKVFTLRTSTRVYIISTVTDVIFLSKVRQGIVE